MKLINKLIGAATVIVLLSGCENLDQTPYNSLSTETAFKTVENAEYWRNNFYRGLRASIFGGKNAITEIQSDLLNASAEFGNRGGEEHAWRIQEGSQDVQSIWSARYSALTDINECIAKFPTIQASGAKLTLLNQYLGEAYAFRAYYFFDLVQLFSPKYEESKKDIPNLGIPLVLTYDVTAKPQRATLAQTYDQILQDINQAETLLATKQGKVGATTFTVDAVKALKARVLLNMGNYSDAYTVAAGLVDSGKYPLVTTQDALEKMWHKDSENESITQLFVAADELSGISPYNGGDFYLGYNSNTKYYNPDYIPSKWVTDLYENTDLRKGVYVKDLSTNFTVGTFTTTLAYKYTPGLYTNMSNYSHKPKIFRIAEQYLIAAEAAYKNNDETNAKKYLNSLRTKRGVNNISTTGDALFEDIKKERIRELAFEGFRLNDLKRWGEACRRHTPQNIAYLLKSPANQYYQLNKEANDYMFTWPIPSYDILLNTNLKQNEGY